MTSFRKTSSSKRRATDRRQFATRALIVCGGRKTERKYLEGLHAFAKNPAVKIILKSEDTSPLDIVKSGSKLRDLDPEAYDEVWAVFDVDEFDVSQAVNLAQRLGIEVAVSNPCFELWLLLHFQAQTGYLKNYREVLIKLKKHLPNYQKQAPVFDDFLAGIGHACQRARALDEQADASYSNPSTGVWRLVSRIHPPAEPTTKVTPGRPQRRRRHGRS